jgi:hypothetical protein
MRIAAKGILTSRQTKPGIECIAERRRWLRWPAQAEHALVSGFAGELVGFLARCCRALLRAARTPLPKRRSRDFVLMGGDDAPGRCRRQAAVLCELRWMSAQEMVARPEALHQGTRSA